MSDEKDKKIDVLLEELKTLREEIKSLKEEVKWTEGKQSEAEQAAIKRSKDDKYRFIGIAMFVAVGLFIRWIFYLITGH